MKFIKGDAIAGILITVINISAGLAIGVFQWGLSFPQAARTYTLLTIGDGLASQIPALLIVTAAALVVSRLSADSLRRSTRVVQRSVAKGSSLGVLPRGCFPGSSSHTASAPPCVIVKKRLCQGGSQPA